MASADDYLAELRRHIGTTEKPVNRNPFSAQLGRSPQAWCADFVAACARNVGLKLPSESAWTPSMADAFKRAGRWSTEPHRGDVAFFDFPGDNSTGIQHVAVVQTVLGRDYVRTVEGNTSSGTAGSQDNGGGVYERTRPRSYIVGYGRPAYEDAPLVLAHGDLPTEEELVKATVIERRQGGYIVIQNDGGVFNYDGAPFCGSVPGLKPPAKLGGNVIGGAWTESGQGYWLLAADGAVYAFGDARYYGGFNAEKPETRGGRIAVGMVRTGPASYRIVTFDPSGDKSPYDGYEYRAK